MTNRSPRSVWRTQKLCGLSLDEPEPMVRNLVRNSRIREWEFGKSSRVESASGLPLPSPRALRGAQM
jgi:hypothetical protein